MDNSNVWMATNKARDFKDARTINFLKQDIM